MSEGVGAAEAAQRATIRTFGSFHPALMAEITLRWTVDPERVPSSQDFVDGLRTMIDPVGDA